MMQHRDALVADVTVVIEAECAVTRFDDVVARLKAEGMEVCDANRDEGVVEGTVEASRIAEIQKLPCVSYVRTEFRYIADYPAGDSRDLDQGAA